MDLGEGIDGLAARTGFTGALLVRRGTETVLGRAYGWAHRGYQVPNTVDTRFGIASGTKGFTALVVVSLIVDGLLALTTRVRELLGPDLPLIADAVTVEQLLAHRSGIGEYFGEDAQPPPRPQEFTSAAAYLPALDGQPQRFRPGARFAYNNGGYAVLAILAERAAGLPFAELVRTRVTEPAGMPDTAFLRSDELPARTATGYLEDGRTNVFSLPVVGSGDGGCYSTAPDFAAFWPALQAGRIVPREWVARMTAVHSPETGTREKLRYGLGFWLPARGDTVLLEGYDYGVSFRSVWQPGRELSTTVLSNTAEGAWPVVRHLAEEVLPGS
ncbi:CubicO group peptidase (beta-lactamase class C family) [Amycolatopsis sulphurea]|uniref:CubicO group peptidase (Beta-lactamase class C family) n=1 Tax=Amycolatopsis sulphurea TaxID=76022 RepID=A0A2A9FB15_9PSEU|nr:serine hydrolase domain-containing protein [Amycolatopsis sulphurea]PFG48544.1 CubicO group peptidase (beta-lactamase class C family) [Amycolatopsis sulphurea]